MAFPMGLPEWDPVRLCIDGGNGELDGFPTSNDALEEDTAQVQKLVRTELFFFAYRTKVFDHRIYLF